MAGIYIIKSGTTGYIGLDSNAKGTNSPRLEDHVAHAYGISSRDVYNKGGYKIISKGESLPNAQVQTCELIMSQNMPSSYQYYLNTDKFFGLPKHKYTLFSKIGEIKNAEPIQSGAETCYIYHYRNTYASLNEVGGGALSTYDCQLASLIDVDHLNISSALKEKLKTPIHGIPQRGTMDLSVMERLFYPELKFSLFLKEYAYETIQNFIQKNALKGITHSIQQTNLQQEITAECNKINNECNVVFQKLAKYSTALGKNYVKLTPNAAGIQELKNALDVTKLPSPKKTKGFGGKKSKSFSLTIIDYDIKIILLKNKTLPKGFPSNNDFSLKSFYSMTGQMKRYVVTAIVPSLFEKANPSSYDIHQTEDYFKTLSSMIYSGITNKEPFRVFYNQLLNYYLNKKEGPLRLINQTDEEFTVRRNAGKPNLFTTIEGQYNDILDPVTYNNIIVG